MTVLLGLTKPKSPVAGWQYFQPWDLPGEVGHVWRNSTLMVISSRGDMEYRGVVVPQFHVSVSVGGSQRRPNDDELATVRKDFDMEDAEEDNHSNGRIRNLFRPEHLPKGIEGVCDCKENEETITEADGFQWQREKVR
jgi:hypothetical protein